MLTHFLICFGTKSSFQHLGVDGPEGELDKRFATLAAEILN